MKPMYLIELNSGDAVYIRENDGRLHKYSLCYMTEKGVLITRQRTLNVTRVLFGRHKP